MLFRSEGIDFEGTFAPVAKFMTVRIMLALATHFDWEVEQMDVKTAFVGIYAPNLLPEEQNS